MVLEWTSGKKNLGFSVYREEHLASGHHDTEEWEGETQR